MSKEDDFLQQIHSKQVAAFRELFREFYNTLVLFSMNYVDRQEIAEDIVQDLFVTIWAVSYTHLLFIKREYRKKY